MGIHDALKDKTFTIIKLYTYTKDKNKLFQIRFICLKNTCFILSIFSIFAFHFTAK